MDCINQDNGRVLVLLSLYNGERFLKEQLDSLLNQTVPIDILARDDGSSDHTVDIVKKYAEEYRNISLIQGENLGFVKSFNSLMMSDAVVKYQWIAFCDQDDFWLPDKLEVAIKKLSKADDQTKPLMYCSNLNVVDSELNHIRYMHPSEKKVFKSCIYVQNIATGCTMLFNSAAALMYREIIDIPMIAHDYTMHCICKCFGQVIYDFKSYILYRQHDENSIGASGVSFFQGVKNIASDIIQPSEERRVKFFSGFLSSFRSDMDDEQYNYLFRFVNYKKSLITRLSLAFNPTIIGYETKATIAFKLRALVGRMY